ncbi:Uncharacterised protein [Mycoplasmopsis arginini]|nr:Uncharacterised protein [Chlamydia abortus]SGA07985.1 Uncharacterised protein [Mycoplasmopsis arginini]SGA08697.1 Uncharacterised protein [Mycoplasmopsis arginini]SGA31875.1 Uncharacterised protein [Chlamydia abortus]
MNGFHLFPLPYNNGNIAPSVDLPNKAVKVKETATAPVIYGKKNTVCQKLRAYLLITIVMAELIKIEIDNPIGNAITAYNNELVTAV